MSDIAAPPRILNSIHPDTTHQLNVSRTTVYELIATGALKTVRIGRRSLVPQSEIDEYVERLVGEAASRGDAA